MSVNTALIFCILSLLSFANSIKTGGWKKTDTTSGDVRDAAVMAVNVLSDRDNSIYHKKLVRVIDAQKQIVAGVKYSITLQLQSTNCRKNEVQRKHIDMCDANNNEKTEICNVVVHMQPWKNKTELLKFDCRLANTEMHSDNNIN